MAVPGLKFPDCGPGASAQLPIRLANLEALPGQVLLKFEPLRA